MSPFGARRATCSTARFSVMLIFSPRNMASIRDSQARLFGQLDQELEGFIGDAILRVVQEEAHRLRRHPLAAPGITGEEISQM